MEKLIQTIKEIIREELNELARPSQLYKIENQDKADSLINLYSQTEGFKWIGNAIKIIKEAGADGVALMDLLDTLSREYGENKTSQEINPPLSRLMDGNVLGKAGLSFTPKVKPPKGTTKRGRPSKGGDEITETIKSSIRIDKLVNLIK